MPGLVHANLRSRVLESIELTREANIIPYRFQEEISSRPDKKERRDVICIQENPMY